MRTIFLLLSTFIFLNIFATCKLVYVATVFRHGARYPLGDIFDGNQTKQFHGKLTSVGMRQQYLLGSYIKADYIDKAKLVNSTLFPKQVQVFADSSQRCVESAISHLLGLFPFGTGPYLPEGINSSYLNPPFQNLADPNIRVSEQIDQSLIAAQFATRMGFQPVPYINSTQFFPKCPNENQIITKRIETLSVKFAQFQAVHAAFTQKMRIVFNLKTEYANVAGLAELFDVVICDLTLGRAMPAQFTDYDFNQLKYIQNYLFDSIYGDNLASIFATDVSSAIIHNMQNRVKNGDKEVKRLSIYSGHDTNVVPLLNFYNLTNPQCISRKWKNETVTGNCAEVPPFASNIIFELHQNDSQSQKYFVKLRYNGDYYNLCQKNNKQCDFTEFAARSKAQFVNVKKECGIKQNSNIKQQLDYEQVVTDPQARFQQAIKYLKQHQHEKNTKSNTITAQV